MPPQPFKISIPDSRIEDLNTRLGLATFPSELDDAGWDYGAPLADVKRLTNYWHNQFDWRKAEQRLNDSLPQFTTDITLGDGFGTLNIHFVHKPSNISSAIPLLFIHGWPGSFIEVSKIIDHLVQGDGQSPAFHVVAISLPNYGFSEGSKKRGFGMAQYAETANKLMLQLGYDKYVTQGGDWGVAVSRKISLDYPQHCKAIHLNMDSGQKPEWTKQPILALQHALSSYSKSELAGLKRSMWFADEGTGYFKEQSTKPQTIGYALQDSPVALLAWIYEKLHDWTDGYPWTDEEVCTWVSIYWFSTAGPAASTRIYYESVHSPDRAQLNRWIPDVKIGYSHFPQDLRVLPRSWMHTLGPVVFQKEHESGGHFAAWERPQNVVDDLRAMFGKKGGAYKVVQGKTGYREESARL